MKNFAVLVSGNGRGAKEIINDSINDLIKPKLSLILTSNSQSNVIEYAHNNSIPIVIIERNNYVTKIDFENAIIKTLKTYSVDYIFLAGWMFIVGNEMLNAFKNRIVNIHPSLLPSFKGFVPWIRLWNMVLRLGITHLIDEHIEGTMVVNYRFPLLI